MGPDNRCMLLVAILSFGCKVENNYLLLLLGHLYLSGMWFGVVPRVDINKTYVKRRLDCYSKYNNYSRFNSEHNWVVGGGYMTIQ